MSNFLVAQPKKGNKIKTKIIALAVAIVIPLNIFAATTTDASAQKKAKELIKLLNIKNAIDSSMAEITNFSSKMIDSQDLTAEEKVEAKKMMEASMKATFTEMKNIDWDKMFADVYASVFTAEEIDGLIEFYKSPLGQKLLSKEPELTKQTMQKMQVEMAKIMPKLQANIAKAISEASNEASKNNHILQKHKCINNLRMIDAAKQQAAIEKGWNDNTNCDLPKNKESVNAYIKGGNPTCLAGGTYTYNTVIKDPTCTIPDHALAH